MNKKVANNEWVCPLCEAFNTTNINKCNVCLSWRCTSCKKYNPITVGKCTTCHKPKQSVGVIKNKKKKRKHKRHKPSDDNINPNDPQIKDKLPHIESNIKLSDSKKVNKPKPKGPYPINIPNYNKSPNKSVLKTNARVYQSKNKQKTYSNISKKPVRVALRNQNILKTNDNLSHQYMNNYKSHSVSSKSISPHSTYQNSSNQYGFPYRNNNNNNKSVSPPRSHYPSHSMHQNRNVRQSPRQEQKQKQNYNNSSHGSYKQNDNYHGNNNNNNNNRNMLSKNHENVQKLVMFGYKMENIERAWNMMQQNNKHKSIVCDHGGLFIETMLDYLSRIPSYNKNNLMRNMNNKKDRNNKIKVKKQKSKYGIGEELYFKCKRVVIIAVDEDVYDVWYMIRYLDNGKEERAKEMYLKRRNDYYEQIGISQERNNVFMNGKYDNDENESFYGPIRDQF